MAEEIIFLGSRRKKYLTLCQILRSIAIYIQINKVFFNIVKDLLNSIERLFRSGKTQLGSKAERIIVLGSLRKKYLTHCKILRSKVYLNTV